MVASIAAAVDLLAALVAFTAERPFAVGAAEVADGNLALAAAIAHDTPALYRTLIDGFAYQGISDANARSYIDLFGNAEWHGVERLLNEGESCCPKLAGFASYRGCSYRKALWSCGNPNALATCPVPSLPLRKGMLNEQAFSLFFFIRDRCGSDLVGFIDAVIAAAAGEPEPIAGAREALLAAFEEIAGVSRKLASMMLATMLMAAGPRRPAWIAVGSSMVAIDSLVHNWLHRTGILAAHAAPHPYGRRCFGDQGCEAIIRDLAKQLQDRLGRPADSELGPRRLQHAVWRFCAADELAICNGNNIRDQASCTLDLCPLWAGCSHLPLRPAAAKPQEDS